MLAGTGVLAAVVVVVVSLLGSGGRPAPGRRPAAPGGEPNGALAGEATALARTAAAPWSRLQRRDGSFRDYVVSARGAQSSQDQYGTEMLGYALLDRGIRDGDRSEIAAGLRAVASALRRPVESNNAPFEALALASAYNLASGHLGGDGDFARLRPTWVAWLTRLPLRAIDQSNRPYYNWDLVEVVAIAELLAAHLGSRAPGAVLADPSRARAIVRRIMGVRVAAAARESSTASPAGPLTLLSDPPLQPLAYQAFSIGLLARAIDRLGVQAPAQDASLLLRLARASGAAIGPAGELSYVGRSQEEAWVQAMTAFGVATAAGGAAPTARRELLAVAQRALERLRLYRSRSFGLWIVPALRANVAGGVRGLDAYATATSYTGLTVLGLDWAADALARAAGRVGELGGERATASVLGHGAGTLVTVRRPDVWFAVRQTPAEHAPVGRGSVDYFGDLRFDAGLMAVDWLAGGRWSSVLPERPLTGGAADSAGPRLVVDGAGTLPIGLALRVSPAGVVTLRERFRAPGGSLTRPVEVRFEPLRCGVRIVVPTRPGERWEYSAFFAAAPRRVGARALGDASQRVTYSLPARLTLGSGYASGDDPRLARARLQFSPAAGQPLQIAECHA